MQFKFTGKVFVRKAIIVKIRRILVRTSALPAFALYFIMCAVWFDCLLALGCLTVKRSLVLNCFAFRKANAKANAL